MPKFVKTGGSDDEDVLFCLFANKIKAGLDKEKTYLVKEGETVEGTVTSIKDSPTYKKIFQLAVKGAEKPVLILGKTDLVNQMCYGDPVVEEGDLVRITFVNKTKTQKNHDWYNFEVEVAKA
ncbi:MAG: hypothetical protein ACLFUH_01005 [Bacteroidales bacterium]